VGIIFRRGNKTMGVTEVTGIGNASVTHQIPIKRAEAAIFLADNGILESGIRNRKAKNITIPNSNP
jgi:hypothetical protein